MKKNPTREDLMRHFSQGKSIADLPEVMHPWARAVCMGAECRPFWQTRTLEVPRLAVHGSILDQWIEAEAPPFDPVEAFRVEIVRGVALAERTKRAQEEACRGT